MTTSQRAEGSESRAAAEQREVLGFSFPERTRRPLRILGVMPWRELWSMGRGAGATAFMRSPVALASYGHELHALHPSARGGAGASDFAGVRFHRFTAPEVFSDPHLPLLPRLTSRAWRYGAFQWVLRRRALALGRRLRPDLIIAYGVMTAPAARRVADQLGVPLVARYFGNTLSLGLQNRLRWYGNFMERIGFRVPVEAMILTNDGSPAITVLRRLGVDLRPVHFLRNGLPAGVFEPGAPPRGLLASLGLSENAFVLLSATRLHSEKRLDRALRLLARLRGEIPGASLILLGEGPEKATLQRLAEELGVGEAVRFPGAVRNVELTGWYRRADLVLSLLDRTNASNPVFEAMACERCVVALDVGTTREVIRPGETGVLVTPGANEEETLSRLVDAVTELARDADRRRALGRRARPLILDLCGTVAARMQKELSIIEEVVKTGAVVPGNLCAPSR
jgi:glycosyltransferase involved in cell wall biosynthesis